MSLSHRLRSFERDQWTAGVIGLGYVGLPLAITAWRAGLNVVGFDVSEEVISALKAGVSHVDDISDEELMAALEGPVEFTADADRLGEADAIFICVPSPLGSNRQPDLSHVAAAVDTVQTVLRPGQLVCLESTSYPGTTDDYLVPAAEAAGLALDEDVFIAFSPERVSPGEDLKTRDIPKVVGGVTEISGQVAAAAYRRLVNHVHPVSSARVAEMSKLVENTYRSVNIGLVNEMAQLANELEIDIWEVISAASTKPFGFQPFYPGPGVGGHCIPLDPQYLAWRAREANFATRFIDVADQVNRDMPRYVARRVGEVLNDRGLPVFGSRILGVGISYKADISDDRESASLEVLGELRKRGAEISVLDPHVRPGRIESLGYERVAGAMQANDFAMALILTDHEAIEYEALADRVPLVFDTRDAYRRRGVVRQNVITL